MNGKELFSYVEVRPAINPAQEAGNTAHVGDIIDRQNFESLLFAIAIGTLADADATFTVLVEHGDQSDLSDAAPVPDTELHGTEAGASFTFADDDSVRKIGYRGVKRYVRLTITPALNAAAADFGAVAILGGARKIPRSAQAIA